MFDDFRQQAEDSFLDQEPVKPPKRLRSKFLGLTPPQMFIVSLLLLLLTCVLGSACLLATGSVVPGGWM